MLELETLDADDWLLTSDWLLRLLDVDEGLEALLTEEVELLLRDDSELGEEVLLELTLEGLLGELGEDVELLETEDRLD